MIPCMDEHTYINTHTHQHTFKLCIIPAVSFQEQLTNRKIANHKKTNKLIDMDEYNNNKKKKNKRLNKNRPTEMSSKRQVSRFRQVVEDSDGMNYAGKTRDPRFDSMSGTLNIGHWNTAYSFLKQHKEDEINELKKKIKKCKKNDVYLKEKLTKQMSKLKNELVTKEKFDKRKELEKKIRKRERDQIASGKKPYFMKKSMLREEELKEKYKELEEQGQLNKYMSKRRKKNSSKDRKALPWVEVE